jgi:hypothetical protein
MNIQTNKVRDMKARTWGFIKEVVVSGKDEVNAPWPNTGR